jgi:hypothetical protein
MGRSITMNGELCHSGVRAFTAVTIRGYLLFRSTIMQSSRCPPMFWNNVLPSRAGSKKPANRPQAGLTAFCFFHSSIPKILRVCRSSILVDSATIPKHSIQLYYWWLSKSFPYSRLAHLTFSSTLSLLNTSTVTAERDLHSWKSLTACKLPLSIMNTNGYSHFAEFS